MQFYIYKYGKTYGPYSEESIKKYLHSGKVAEDDWAWTQGLKEWVRLSDLVDIGEGQEQTVIEPYELTEDQVIDYSNQIKGFISRHRQYPLINNLSLFLSLNSSKLCEYLLKDCLIDEDGRPQLPDWFKDNEKGDESISFFLELGSLSPSPK